MVRYQIFLMIEVMRFLARLDVVSGRNFEDDFKVYDLSSWKDGVIIYSNGED